MALGRRRSLRGLGCRPKLTTVIVAGESHDRKGTVCQAMQQPVSVSLDLTAETGYVADRVLRSGERVAYTRTLTMS